MKGSSSSAYARKLIAAILMVLILLAGASAKDQLVYEKVDGTISSNERALNSYHIWQSETDDEGHWEICQLPPGIYKVCEVDLVGWTQSNSANETSGDPACHVVEITNSSVSDIDFLNRGDYNLSGHKYWDENKNGQRDPYEEYLSGWIITVEGETNLWRTTTNNVGYWRIPYLPPGTYSISESHPNGEMGWIASERPSKITITNASIHDLDFGNYRVLYDEPNQYEQFCESSLVEGTGYADVGSTVTDKKLALDYKNKMFGEGNIELESAQVYSQQPNKLIRPIPNCSDPNGTTLQKLNFYENTKLEFEGIKPLVGSKSLSSKEFYGGIGAAAQENYSVNWIESDQTIFFGSTTNSTIRKTVGLTTQNSFEGIWSAESGLHKIFYKDIRRKDLFAGEFSVQRELKFHENPSDFESMMCLCEGVDC